MKLFVLPFLISLVFAQPSPAERKVMPFEERVLHNWKSMTVAIGSEMECTGFEIGIQFTITRTGGGNTIFTTTTARDRKAFPADPEIVPTQPVALSDELLDAIVKSLSEHYKVANKELNVEESLDLYPDSIPIETIRERMATKGQIFGTEKSSFFVVVFNPGKFEEKYLNAFAKPESFQSYAEWLQGYRIYAAPKIAM